jgi:hypothetical protein
MSNNVPRYQGNRQPALAALAACGSSASSSGSPAPSSATTTAASPSASAPAGPQTLVGTIRLTAGQCEGSSPSGSYFRMIVPGGTIQAGKFFNNPDSLCTDKSYTLVGPGTAGGFVTGKYQPNPTPPFDASGNALTGQIVAPTGFTGIKFSISTNPQGPADREASADREH